MAIRAQSRRSRQQFDIWPGFVDALSGLLIVMLFVLSVFMVAQFFLGEIVSGQDKTIDRLQARIGELARMLSLEQSEAEEARRRLEQLQLDLRATIEARDKARAARDRALAQRDEALAQRDEARAGRETAEAERDRALAQRDEARAGRETAEAERDKALAERESARERAAALEGEVEAQRRRRLSAEEQLDLLNRQIAALRIQLAAIQEALEASEAQRQQQQLEIENLGERLNAALATEVQRLQRYRSDFFGRVREVLGDREDIQIVGDRFVFQSEVLFPSASDELAPGGKVQLAQVADILKEIMDEIPEDIDWVLRVDGHTDIRPLRANHPRFKDNLELSTFRAIAVVRFLRDEGIPPERMVAAGFGEHHPLVDERSPEAFARNRRIELKITQR